MNCSTIYNKKKIEYRINLKNNNKTAQTDLHVLHLLIILINKYITYTSGDAHLIV